VGWVDRIASSLGFERRARGDSVASLAMSSIYEAAAPSNAEAVAAVGACVQLIASTLAYLPMRIYRAGPVRTEVLAAPLYRLMRHGPNDWQTWPDLIESMVASMLLNGNALARIERSGAEVTGLRFLPWRWVTVQLLPSGRLRYDVQEAAGVTGAGAGRYSLAADDVIHLRDRSDDGYLGRSRLSRTAQTVASALQANEFARKFLENGAMPAGAVKIENRINPEQMAMIRENLNSKYTGYGNAGRTLILEAGVSYEPFALSPEDTELLASRKFAVEEICRIFQVPPPLVQDYSHNTFTNSETAGRWFAQFTLSPLARKIEAEFARSLFDGDSDLEIEMDLSGFLRGDPQTRWAAHKIAVDAGILDANEVREIEGFNPRPMGNIA
jgi:HK97 family phage portal protein